MAMMAKMRSLAPAFILTVGVLFVVFMVISDSSVLENFGGRTNDVGSINGENISYQNFSKILNDRLEDNKKQTGKSLDDNAIKSFRDQVWDAIVTQTIFAQQIKKYNITVSDDEIKDVILSDNPPDFLKRNFIDSTGKFNKIAYNQAIFDPRNNLALLQAENFVRQKGLTDKLQSLVLASINVGESEILKRFKEENTKVSLEYALFPLTNYSDSSISINDDEIKKYYNSNIDKYKVQETRVLDYVLFPINASAEDSQFVKRNFLKIIKNFSIDNSNFKKDAEIYSSAPTTTDTVSISLFTANVSGAILKAKPGSLVGPSFTPGGMTLYHLLKTIPSKNLIARASHILINQFGSDKKNKEEAIKLYKELKKGADFNTSAKLRSADPGTAKNGGDLGWFGKGRMVKSFEKAVFSGKIGSIQKPIKTNFGYHIIKVTGKLKKKFVLEKIYIPLKPSETTKDQIKNIASDFAFLAKKNGYEKEVKLGKYISRITTPFKEASLAIQGIGSNKRLVKFAFENGVNEVSDIFSIRNGYAVVRMKKIIQSNIKELKEVKATIVNTLKTIHKYKLVKNKIVEIKKKLNSDLSKVTSFAPNVKVTKTGEIKPGQSIPGVGKNYGFINYTLNGKLNEISDPIKGRIGYYLVRNLSRSAFDSSAYAIQKNTLRDKILSEKKSAFLNDWITSMKDNADIVDNRYIFYGQ